MPDRAPHDRAGPPGQPAVDEPATEGRQQLKLGFAEVPEHEGIAATTRPNSPITQTSVNIRKPRNANSAAVRSMTLVTRTWASGPSLGA